VGSTHSDRRAASVHDSGCALLGIFDLDGDLRIAEFVRRRDASASARDGIELEAAGRWRDLDLLATVGVRRALSVVPAKP
jgi:hypothetical protein